MYEILQIKIWWILYTNYIINKLKQIITTTKITPTRDGCIELAERCLRHNSVRDGFPAWKTK